MTGSPAHLQVLLTAPIHCAGTIFCVVSQTLVLPRGHLQHTTLRIAKLLPSQDEIAFRFWGVQRRVSFAASGPSRQLLLKHQRGSRRDAAADRDRWSRYTGRAAAQSCR